MQFRRCTTSVATWFQRSVAVVAVTVSCGSPTDFALEPDGLERVSPLRAAPLAPDDQQLGIVSFTDPNHPTREIGKRELTVALRPVDGDTVRSVKLQYGDNEQLRHPIDAYPIPPDLHVGQASVRVGPTGERIARFVLPREDDFPLRKKQNNAREQFWPEINPKFFSPNETVYYRWVVEHASGALQYGAVHGFTLPRPITVAIMGDSFISGEGAPAEGDRPWIHDMCHRLLRYSKSFTNVSCATSCAAASFPKILNALPRTKVMWRR